MPSVYLCPVSTIFQYFTDVGAVLNGGKINTYVAGSSTPQATYTDSTGTVSNANPIVLASNGRLNNVQIWQPLGVKLKIVVTDANNNQLGPVFDQIAGIGDPTALTSVYYGGTDTGSANTYVLTIANAGFSSYINGLVIYWIPSNNNTGASTININGLGAVNITNIDGSALTANQLVSGQVSVILSQGGNFVLSSISTQSGTFNGTWTGFSSPPANVACEWIQSGRLVVLTLPTPSVGTSNAITLGLSGLPAQIRPIRNQTAWICGFIDNGSGVTTPVSANVLTSGSINFIRVGAGSWTNSGSKGLDSTFASTTIAYALT